MIGTLCAGSAEPPSIQRADLEEHLRRVAVQVPDAERCEVEVVDVRTQRAEEPAGRGCAGAARLGTFIHVESTRCCCLSDARYCLIFLQRYFRTISYIPKAGA